MKRGAKERSRLVLGGQVKTVLEKWTVKMLVIPPYLVLRLNWRWLFRVPFFAGNLLYVSHETGHTV
jgi:hypothetical protein